jgi:hypothetical protein
MPDECQGNPCEAQVICDLVNAIKNKHKLEGRVRNHAWAIRIEDIKKLQGVTESRVPPVLFQWALTSVDSLDVTQRVITSCSAQFRLLVGPCGPGKHILLWHCLHEDL